MKLQYLFPLYCVLFVSSLAQHDTQLSCILNDASLVAVQEQELEYIAQLHVKGYFPCCCGGTGTGT